jgi:hypothetical protein
MGEIVRRVIATSLIALTAAAAGAQQAPQQTPVDGGERVIVYGMVPIPDVGEGAPRFTSKDVEVIEKAARDVVTDSSRDMRICQVPAGTFCKLDGRPQELLACEVEYGAKAANLAGMAVSASAAAEAVRRAAAKGEADMKAVEEAELVRQEAVNKMQEARQKLLEIRARMGDIQKNAMGFRGWDANHQEMKRRKAGWGLGVAVPDVPEGLSIINVKVTQLADTKGKGDFARVQGDIRNSGAKSAKIPGLAATLIDEKGFPLNTTSVSPSNKGSIPAGKTRPFQFDMRPAPELTKTAIVTFAPEGAPEPRIRMNGILCPRGRATSMMGG